MATIQELNLAELDAVSGGIDPVTIGVITLVVGIIGGAYLAGYDTGKDMAERDNRADESSS